MTDPMADVHQAGPVLPGEPLESGFRFRPARDVPEVGMSPEARERVFEKMQSVYEARLRAAGDGHTAYVG